MSTETRDKQEAPGFYDLYDQADISLPKRIARRYFVTKNYERSIRMHEMLGSKVVRAVVMNTVGRAHRESFTSNYRIGKRGNPLNRTSSFAFHGSVFNEAVHGAGAVVGAVGAVPAIIEQGPDLVGTPFLASGVLFNLSLVALQRYNRARMIKFLDTALKAGREFRPGYHNWAGIDSVTQQTMEPAEVMPAPLVIENTGVGLHSPQHVPESLSA